MKEKNKIKTLKNLGKLVKTSLETMLPIVVSALTAINGANYMETKYYLKMGYSPRAFNMEYEENLQGKIAKAVHFLSIPGFKLAYYLHKD